MASFCSASPSEALLAKYNLSKVYFTVFCMRSKMFWSSVATNCSILFSTSDWNQALVSWFPSKTDLQRSAVSLIRAWWSDPLFCRWFTAAMMQLQQVDIHWHPWMPIRVPAMGTPLALVRYLQVGDLGSETSMRLRYSESTPCCDMGSTVTLSRWSWCGVSSDCSSVLGFWAALRRPFRTVKAQEVQ
jgi:hypothetical protein